MMGSDKWIVCTTCYKGVHGVVSADLLVHKKLAKAFNSWDFAMNPCDPCVWKKMKLSKQILSMFYIDDLMTSYESSTIVTKNIKLLDASCGAKHPFTGTRGKPHGCLGMKICFSLKRGVATTQNDFIKSTWMTLPPDLKGNHRSMPATYSLFKVDANVPLLNHARKET